MLKGWNSLFRNITGNEQEFQPKCESGTSANGTASSRSTSTGSSPQEVEGRFMSSQLPTFEYPSPFTVRNTFIDEESELQRLCRDRELKSAPAGTAAQGCGDDHDDRGTCIPYAIQGQTSNVVSLTTQAPVQPLCRNDGLPGYWVQAAQVPIMPPQPQPQHQAAPTDASFPTPGTQMMLPPVAPAQPAPAVLCLADVLEPALGSPGCPTMGSAGHYRGDCKPCAFFHTKGCGNGAQCTFCHLCDASERKMRVQEKRQNQREERQRRRGLTTDN